jgi:Type IX secretion system protein PorV
MSFFDRIDNPMIYLTGNAVFPRCLDGGKNMLNKMATRAFLTACVFLSFAVVPLLAQGVARQDYSGLDKYPTQGKEPSSSFAGVRAAEFLTIPVGARGIGMGSAFTAVADDITSIWWNPAGLGFIENREVMVNVVDYTMDLTYSYAAVAAPVMDGRLVLGGFFGYLDVPDMEITTIERPDGTGSFFNAYDFQMGGSLAYTLSDRFIGGLNVKYVHQDVYGNIGGSAFAIDAGAIYHTELADREIKFSFAIQNLGTNITMTGTRLYIAVGPEDSDYDFPTGYGNYANTSSSVAGENSIPEATSRRNSRQAILKTNTYRLPTTVKLAVAYNLFTSEKANWLASAELWRPSYIPIAYATGTELTYQFDMLTSASLRMGWMIQTDEYTENADDYGYDYLGSDNTTYRGFSIGGGIQRSFGGRALSFNYAYKNKGNLSADNFFTVTLGF